METQRAALRLRLFYFAERATGRLHRLVQAVYRGFWLGVLDTSEINTVVLRSYEENKVFQTAAHNLYGFFPWERDFVRQYFDGCRSVVVAAAGGGREMIALARAGVHVEGFECNPRLVKKCREFLAQAQVSGRTLDALPDQVPSGLQKYDGAIVGCGALSHILGRTKRIEFLKDMKCHLNPGAPLLLSVGRRPQGSHYHECIYRIARAIRMLRRSADSVEPGDDALGLYTHSFTESEVKAELKEAGFAVLTCVEKQEIYAVAQA